MSRRRPKREPSDPKRGRHKKASSPETGRWEQDCLIPARPVWMPAYTYRQLANLRGQL